tara:strand:+ start:9563 stop:10414 length:852 start_codon:yes stop_codon:yes gene_type:complete
MRFSEYLRTLDEGNYGHEYGQEAEKHEEALRANREHAKVKRDEASIGSSEENEAPEETPEEKEKAKKKEKAKNEKEKEEEDEVQLDWQIPSLREDHRQYDPNVTRENKKSKRPKPVDTERWDGHGDPPEGYEDAGGEIGSDGTAELRKKSVKKESLEIPMRDSLGRLSIHSINEASKAKLKRKLKSGNTTYTQKQAAMKQLKLKQADQKKRATKRASTEEDLSVAVRAGDAASEKSVVLPGGDKPLKRSKLRPGSADLQRHEDEQADSRSSDEGTPRQRHLDK